MSDARGELNTLGWDGVVPGQPDSAEELRDKRIGEFIVQDYEKVATVAIADTSPLEPIPEAISGGDIVTQSADELRLSTMLTEPLLVGTEVVVQSEDVEPPIFMEKSIVSQQLAADLDWLIEKYSESMTLKEELWYKYFGDILDQVQEVFDIEAAAYFTLITIAPRIGANSPKTASLIRRGESREQRCEQLHLLLEEATRLLKPSAVITKPALLAALIHLELPALRTQDEALNSDLPDDMKEKTFDLVTAECYYATLQTMYSGFPLDSTALETLSRYLADRTTKREAQNIEAERQLHLSRMYEEKLRLLQRPASTQPN